MKMRKTRSIDDSVGAGRGQCYSSIPSLLPFLFFLYVIVKIIGLTSVDEAVCQQAKLIEPRSKEGLKNRETSWGRFQVEGKAPQCLDITYFDQPS